MSEPEATLTKFSLKDADAIFHQCYILFPDMICMRQVHLAHTHCRYHYNYAISKIMWEIMHMIYRPTDVAYIAKKHTYTKPSLHSYTINPRGYLLHTMH